MDAISSWGNIFAQSYGQGIATIMPSIHWLLTAMLAIGVMFLAMQWLRSGPNISWLMFVIVAGTMVYVLDNWQAIGEGVVSSVVGWGLATGGSNPGAAGAFLSSPDRIFVMGMAREADIEALITDLCAAHSLGCIGDLDGFVTFRALGWLVTFVYAIAAVCVFASIFFFKVAWLVGAILIPLVAIPPVSRIGMFPIKVLVFFGTQLYVITTIISLNTLVLAGLTRLLEPNVAAADALFLSTLVFIVLLIGAQAITALVTVGGFISAGNLLASAPGMAVSLGRAGAGQMAAASQIAGGRAAKAASALSTAAGRASTTKAA